MNFLHLSKDRKVSPQGIYQQSRDRWIPTIPNSFGLPAGASCPGRTGFCDSCYAASSERSQHVGEAVQHNLRVLMEAGSVDAMTVLLSEMVARYVRTAERKDVSEQERIFRIHWDGDFFSVDYARAWARVIRGTPEVSFWAYTRSFVDPVNVVPVLVGIDNLTLYLSADEHNIEAALEMSRTFDIPLALCAEDFDAARALAPDRRAIVCPENAQRMPLMSKQGRGACVDCGLCVTGRADVMFSTSHQDNVAIPQPRIRKSHRPEHIEEPPRFCENPACNAPLKRKAGPGRRPKYCSTQCRWDARRPAPEHRASAYEQRRCLNCDAPLPPNRGRPRVYCSPECRKAVYLGHAS